MAVASEVEILRDYLRIRTDYPNPDYQAAIEFLQNIAVQIGLEFSVFNYNPENPVLVMTWPGQRPEEKALMLSSHMDVVSARAEDWTHPPFAAEMDEDGNIYARGAQDMKSVTIQYLEAIRRLKIHKKESFRRTIHLVFVPDEENSGIEGMKKFCEREEFRKLNVGFALDEGSPAPGDRIMAYYAERSRWLMEFKCRGPADQMRIAARFLQDTAVDKMRRLLDKLYLFRDDEKQRMKNEKLRLGDVTTLNVVNVQTSNHDDDSIVPGEIVVTVNICAAPDKDGEELDAWLKKVESGVEVVYKIREPIINLPKPDHEAEWYRAFYRVAKELDLTLVEAVCPGGTDMKYLRGLGIPALNFEPMNHTEIRLHGDNEYINQRVFLRGIEIYEKIIAGLANE